MIRTHIHLAKGIISSGSKTMSNNRASRKRNLNEPVSFEGGRPGFPSVVFLPVRVPAFFRLSPPFKKLE